MSDPLEIRIEHVSTDRQQDQAFEIRRQVFVYEQSVDEAIELDGLDLTSDHLLASVGGQIVGTLRVRALKGGNVAKIERVAVLKPWRGKGVGRRLMAEAITLCRRSGAMQAKVHAQTHAAEFYRLLGFEPVGDEFEEDSIPHIAMFLSFDLPTVGLHS